MVMSSCARARAVVTPTRRRETAGRRSRARAHASKNRHRSIAIARGAVEDGADERVDGVDARTIGQKVVSVVLASMLAMTPAMSASADDALDSAAKEARASAAVVADASKVAETMEGKVGMDVESMYAKTLDVESMYARAVADSKEFVEQPLKDDKDNKEYETWPWQKLVTSGGGSGAAKKTVTPKAPSAPSVRAAEKQAENARRLEEVKAKSALASAEKEAARLAKIAERDAIAQAKVDARRAAQSELFKQRAKQAEEETRAKREARDAQRARNEALRMKSTEEKLAEAEAFRNRNAPSTKKKFKALKRSAATKKPTTEKKAAYASKPKPASKPKLVEKYSGALDRNSFRNVKRQEYGAGAAPFAFVAACGLMYYLLLQEEED